MPVIAARSRHCRGRLPEGAESSVSGYGLPYIDFETSLEIQFSLAGVLTGAFWPALRLWR